MQVLLQCRTCRNSNGNYMPDRPGFVAVGYYENIEWSQSHRKIPTKYSRTDHWPRSNRTPNIQEKCVIRVKHPFQETVGGVFWAFYEPLNARINGWSECLEEIQQAAFVQCRIIKVLSQCNDQAWLKIRIVDRIYLSQAIEQIPQQHEGQPFLDHVYGGRSCYRTCLGSWQYCSGSTEGDVGHWMLVHGQHLIAYGEWDFHTSSAYLGNLRLSSDTYAAMLNRYKLNQA